MSLILRGFLALILAAVTSAAWGHGIYLTLSADQTAVTPTTETLPPLNGAQNLFYDSFGGSGPLTTDEGFAFTDGSSNFPAGTTYTFNITSPLLYSAGGAAGPANGAINVEIYERFPFGTTDPNFPTTPTVAANGDININGNSTFFTGFQVNGFDPHELEKVMTGSAIPDGVYGYAFTVTAHWAGGSVTSGTLVDAFDTPGFDASASTDLLNSAYFAVYTAAVVPEPSGIALAVTSGCLVATILVKRRRRSQTPGIKKCPTDRGHLRSCDPATRGAS